MMSVQHEMESKMKTGGISADWLKVIAMVTMVIDHTGAVLFPGEALWRMVGRVAFPVYMWLLIVGFLHTSNVEKYICRMFLFSLLSEIPFDLALEGTLCTFQYQNVFWTLTLCLCMLRCLKRILDRTEGMAKWKRILPAAVLIAASMAACEWLHFDYGCTAPVLAAAFYFYVRCQKPSLPAGFCLFCLSYLADPVLNGYAKSGVAALQIALAYASSEVYGILAVPLIARYNGVRRWKRGKMLFYLFYPVHLLILYMIVRK